MFDREYFQRNPASSIDWWSTYRRRKYYYRSLCRYLFSCLPAIDQFAEIGCGLGMFSYTILDQHPNLTVHASDISEYAVQITREKLRDFPQAIVSVADAEDSPLPENSCDVVASLDVVEHLRYPRLMIDHAFRILRSGGIFTFTTPNARSLGARLKRARMKSPSELSSSSLLTWFADRDATHINVLEPQIWRQMCTDAGFILVRDGTDGCWDTPYFGKFPVFPQKLFFNGSHQLLMRLTPILPWLSGENYIGVWRKP